MYISILYTLRVNNMTYIITVFYLDYFGYLCNGETPKPKNLTLLNLFGMLQ